MAAESKGATCPTVVCVRMRPLNASESGERCVEVPSPTQIAFSTGSSSADKKHSFAFDHVWGEGCGHEEVFEACEGVVRAAMDGYNGTIMTYGQTGSGKTHTLIGAVGDPKERGVVPRAVAALAGMIAQDTSGATFEVSLSVVEIYCEKIRDLLADDPTRADNLPVKQDADGGMFVEGSVELPVTSEEQLVGVMQRGLAARAVGCTGSNAQSSRSHCLVTVRVSARCPDGRLRVGKLTMADLAGSERQDKTQAAGQQLVEGSLINKSLSTLSNVICALTAGGGRAAAKHIPYRDSKLTRLLQDSLGGSGRTVMIICASPAADHAPETLSSLRFGSRAKGIENTLQANAVRVSDPALLQQQLEVARQENGRLTARLAELEASGGAAASGGAGSNAADGGGGGGTGGKCACSAQLGAGNGGGKRCVLPRWGASALSVATLLAYFAFEDWAAAGAC